MRTIYRILASVIGTAFTLAGCSNGPVDDYGGPTAEYGVPSARYHITGQVLHGTTGQGIAGLQASLHGGPADTTNADGRFSIEASYFPCDDNCDLVLSDIDGPTGGVFAEHEEPLDLEQTEPGDGGWYRGKIRAT